MVLKTLTLTLGVEFFKAFSDPSRLRILALMRARKYMCATDLELILDFSQTKTSRQLIYLKNAGLASNKKIGLWTFYYIKPEVADIVGKLLDLTAGDGTLRKDAQSFKSFYEAGRLSLNKAENEGFFSGDF